MFLRKILRQNEVNNKYTPDYKLFLNFIYQGKLSYEALHLHPCPSGRVLASTYWRPHPCGHSLMTTFWRPHPGGHVPVAKPWWPHNGGHILAVYIVCKASLILSIKKEPSDLEPHAIYSTAVLTSVWSLTVWTDADPALHKQGNYASDVWASI